MNKSICNKCEYGGRSWHISKTFAGKRMKCTFYRSDINHPCFELMAGEEGIENLPNVSNVDKWVGLNVDSELLKGKCPYYCEHAMHAMRKKQE